MAHVNLIQEQLSFLARFNRYQIEGRYPDLPVSEPDLETTQEELEKVGEMFKWIMNLLWELRVKSDSRIEPIPVGKRQWQEDTSSAIIEIARREGEVNRIHPLFFYKNT